MFGISPSIILARPSAAPHIAFRSWFAAAAWRSLPAFSISPSAPPSAITARTVVPGQCGDAPGAIEPRATALAGARLPGAAEGLAAGEETGPPHAAANPAPTTNRAP